MNFDELRPLKRPKLGLPDIYPQETRQKEDELTVQTLSQGLRQQPAHSYEVGSARSDVQHLRPSDFTSRLSQIVDAKKRAAWGQDSQKKRTNLSRDSFWPVPVGRNKKEQASLWFQGLAGIESLEQLIKRKIPIFNKREEIFDVLFEKNVPVSRAVWYIKMTAAHLSLGAELKLTKKKQTADPSFEWTVALTKFMQETVWRISNESVSHHSRHDSVSGSRSHASQIANEETLLELSRWKYISELSAWLYQENLLDRQEFLRWLIERIETSKPDEKSLVLYLPLALKYLLDISGCVYLARPLISFCCQKFASLYEMTQKVQHLIALKQPFGKDSDGLEHMETNEDDDVFSSMGSGNTPSIKREHRASKCHVEPEETVKSLAGRKRGKSGSLTVTIEGSASNTEGSTSGNQGVNKLADKSCKHHTSLLLQLSCIIQMIAIQCPTAFINVNLTSKGSSRDAVSKATTPLDKLPLRLHEMLLPKKGLIGVEKKLESALMAAEHEIRQRTNAAESGWSAMTVADLQTSNKGQTVQHVLSVLKELDKHSFTTCKYHSPLSTMYVKMLQAQKSMEMSVQSREALCMLLCQWAITPHRHGLHRPLVAARLLKKLQSDLLLGQTTTDLDALDEFWEYPGTNPTIDVAGFPFQQTLFQFLDTRAPLPESLYYPLKDNEPFKPLLTLFSELIHLSVFSYTLYLSTLIARGETKSPIIPLLPFFRGESGNPPMSPMESESEELSLTISLPTLPTLIFRSKSPQKKPLLLDVKREEGTISPSLPSAFGSQDNLLDSLDNFSTTPFVHEESLTSIKMEENPSLLQMRADKLERLALLDTMEEGPSQLVSPIGFGSHASSPMKQDVFNFSLNFLDGSSPSQSIDEGGHLPSATTTTETSSSTKLDKQACRHLIYASYFPMNPSEMSAQNLNQRSVVLCGTGHSRAQIEEVVLEMRSKAEMIVQQLAKEGSPVLLNSVVEFMTQYKLLPTFEQNYIACSCVQLLLSPVDGTWSFPSCSQLVFVCEMLELAGSFHQMIQLLIELMTFNEERKDTHKQVSYTPLPGALCLIVVNIFWRYSSVLFLSLHDTMVVYERLFRVLDGQKQQSKLSSSQKAVFLFLKHLHTHCYYIKRNYPALPNFYSDYCVPSVVDMQWQTGLLTRSLNACKETCLLAGSRQAESEKYINEVVMFMSSSSKNSFFFVCEVFSDAVEKQTNLHALTVLAHICAEACCSIDRVPKELLGALRALCIPHTTYKACVTGYTQLTQKTDILSEPSIHGNLVTFVGLLLAFNCFTIHDIITYIVKPIFKVYLLYPQETGNAQKGSLSLEFVSLLLRHLLVDEYIRGEHSEKKESHGIVYPPFVRHFLLAKSQQLSFDVVLNLLKDLLKLCKDTLRSSQGTTFGSKTGMSVLVKSFPSGSEGNEAVLVKLRETMELIAQQSWVREQCSHKDSKGLLELDRLGDASLSPPQAQYLLHLLIPYCPQDTVESVTAPDGSLPPHMVDPLLAIDRILKNLDQWTLCNALLHLQIIVDQATNMHSGAQVEHLSQCVIQVFEDSCSDEWLGQTVESLDDKQQVDGAYSPSIWLVTPLVSDLPNQVLGRILKNAGNVLGRGQWWNPEKSQEKRRTTRATNTAATPTTPAKTGLQWQQPFLELVLACMNSHHSNHDELLVPLQKQLTTFLTAFEKEGMPLDEQNKGMLYTSLRLRLSLVGSMLASVCVSESNILDWVSLLIQLICSGAVDRQPDNSELFTNCLDMLSALLQALTPDFHMCVVSGGEEGKKSYIQCIKKMKGDLASSKSCCKQEIQQLFPLPQKAYEVTIVKPPSFTQQFRSSDKVQGLRIQEVKEISPWEIIEGIRNSGPLQLSWFGAMRMKRKPLKYVEQRRLVRFHSHHKEMETMTSSPHFVCLPVMSSDQPSEPLPPITSESTTVQPVVPVGCVPPDIKPTITSSTTVMSSQPSGMQSSSTATSRTKILDTIRAMNKRQLNPNVPIRPPGPLPPPLRTGLITSINAGMIPSQLTPRSMPTSVVPHPNMGQMSMQPPRPINQAAPPYRPSWYDLFLQDLTPENRNYINSLPIEQKRIHLLNLRRDFERRRILQQQQQQQQQQMRMQGVGFPPHMSHPGGPMHVTPPVQMTQVMQQQQQHRLMATARYPLPAQMPPPAHHPSQPYMVPSHHPQAMFRQPGVMYGQGMPPRQQHMPYPH